MIRILSFSTLVCVALANYQLGSAATGYNPAPAPAYAPLPVYTPPVILPELPAPHEIIYPREESHHDWHHSHDGPRCSECRRIKYYYESDGNGESNIKPLIMYFADKKGCRKAVVSCDKGSRGSVSIKTADDELLSQGDRTSTKLISCNRKGRWETRSIDNEYVDFSTLRCFVPPKVTSTTTTTTTAP